ncbi:hemophore-related protein [Nocardia sp. NPDC058633]|uniref:hemophore-related protein n=1 Tax=Nocardia sp. NPDC058633 TaxID=3346568 RepID=UPI003651A994
MNWKMPQRTPVRIGLVTGFTALAAASTIGVAAAAPAERSHPILDTTCSVEQIEAAALVHAPALAARMAQHPEHREKLAELLAKTPEQRRAAVEQRHGEHAGHHGGERAGLHTGMVEVFAVCGSY